MRCDTRIYSHFDGFGIGVAAKTTAGTCLYSVNKATASGITNGKSDQQSCLGPAYGVSLFFGADQTYLNFGRFNLAASAAVPASTYYYGLPPMVASNFWYGTSLADYGTGTLFNADGTAKASGAVDRALNAALYYYSASKGNTGTRPATGALATLG